jgi:uncharacterized protein (DUF1499 family)
MLSIFSVQPAARFFAGVRHFFRGTIRSPGNNQVSARFESAEGSGIGAFLMARNWTTYGAYLGFGLAAVALVLLAISPLGWREGWWHFRFAFTWLMPYSGYIALTAAVVSLLVLAVGWSRLGRRGLMLAGIGLAAGAVLAYVPWQYDHRLKTLPRIHDITTDTENPPTYVAALPARAAENAAPASYPGPEIAEQQKAAYPDLAPLKVGLPPEQAFRQALDTANTMPGWSVVAADPAAGRIEARETSLWFRFTDDIVIRVAAETTGSRIDMRSESRQGRSDFGVNAGRVRAYMAKLKRQLG